MTTSTSHTPGLVARLALAALVLTLAAASPTDTGPTTPTPASSCSDFGCAS